MLCDLSQVTASLWACSRYIPQTDSWAVACVLLSLFLQTFPGWHLLA